ncbi:phytase [Novosphingobium piscinae]|uniref:Phytase n=1 Tax=Novosphingobium piscinae TaxID=1507448 RepID=A0A7X1KNK3_9SPHN|nr:phytase [Novosphingobium piscinae]MBC2667784.1 phytase [Novosphingobium piscinae]
MRRGAVCAAVAGLLAASALAAAPGGTGQTVNVAATAETRPVGTAAVDAADDPAIWRNPRRPAASLIVATDKRAGLYVYGLDGTVRDFVAAGRVNNVDLLDLGPAGIIVVASDRNDETQARLLVYRLDPATGKLATLGQAGGGAGEAYGVCLVAHGAGIDAFSVLKHGAIHQVRLTLAGTGVSGTIVRSLQLPTQTEGCVVDPRSGTLYVGEEDRGIWAFSTAETDRNGTLVAAVDGRHLVADVEGLALAPVGARGGWLVASSQGDNAYALFRLPGLEPAGRFRIAAGKFGSTEETDGIALDPRPFGSRFPQGLFIAQDGSNAPAAQNFKLVSWGKVRAALERR